MNPLGGSEKLITPFWADVDTSNGGGKVEYTESNSLTLLAKASAQINSAFDFPVGSEFSATSVFFATWEKVRYHGSMDDKVMKFKWCGFICT